VVSQRRAHKASHKVFHKARPLHSVKVAWARQPASLKASHNFRQAFHKAHQLHSLSTAWARQPAPLLVSIALARPPHSHNKALARHHWAAPAWAHNFHKVVNLALVVSQDNFEKKKKKT
jgi:hypothetical protein